MAPPSEARPPRPVPKATEITVNASMEEEPGFDNQSLDGEAMVKLTLAEPAAKKQTGPWSSGLLPDLRLSRFALDLVHSGVWEVARQFGFQTFNLNASASPGARWTPATAFVATDNLTSVIRDGMLRMVQSQENGNPEGISETLRQLYCGQLPESFFILSVFEVHSNIFQHYEKWCDQVGLQKWPSELENRRDGSKAKNAGVERPADSIQTCHMLVCELALYMLIWTEGANVRHMSEVICFLFWCCCHTRKFIDLSSAAVTEESLRLKLEMGPRHLPDASLRDWRVYCRNVHEEIISNSQTEANLDTSKNLPAACLVGDQECKEMHLERMTNVTNVISQHITSSRLVELSACGIVTDLALNGDGGFWMRNIITPIFMLLAQEMEAMSSEEHYHRLGYDDVNESFCNRTHVHGILKKLGDPEKDLTPHTAFPAISVWIGNPESEAVTGAEFTTEQQKKFQTAAINSELTWFDPKRAAAFWSVQVARKTFQENRTWWAVYRAYHRVFLVCLVPFHFMMAQSLTESWDWLPLSSAVLTHAFLTALERYANWVISRPSISVMMRADAKYYGVKIAKGHEQLTRMKSTNDVEQDLSKYDFQSLRLLRKRFRIEGSPLWGIFGFLEWQLLFLALLALYILQFAAPWGWAHVNEADLPRGWHWLTAVWGGEGRGRLTLIWGFAAIIYSGCQLLHFFITLRPGYRISLSQTLRLPYIFTCSSSIPKPECWVAGSLSVTWFSWMVQVLTWGLILIAKWAFEYFAVSKPLAREIHDLLAFRNCDRVDNSDGQCLNISWVLVVVTVAPFVALVLIDGMIMYHAYLTITCLSAGLLRLNYAALPDWSECVGKFHRAPTRWWKKCTSRWGRHRAKKEIRSRYLCDSTGQSNGAPKGVAWWQKLTPCGGDGDSSFITDSGFQVPAKPPFAKNASVKAVTQGADYEKAAQIKVFAHAWDALVADLREGDLLTDSEAHNCSFVRLHHNDHDWSCWSKAAHLVGPVVLPAFFFAGQVQRVVDTGRLTGVQGAILEQLRNLALLLAVNLDLLNEQQANVLHDAEFLAKATNLQHLNARSKTLLAAIKLVQVLLDVTKGKSNPGQGAKALSEPLKHVTEGLEVEYRAAKRLPEDRRSTDTLPEYVAQAHPALEALKDLQRTAEDTGKLSEGLERLVRPTAENDLPRQLVAVLHAMLTTQAAATCPRSSEARRIISAFLNSLSLGSLAGAPALLEVRSLTVLTPLYGEDVMYCLDAEEAARKLGLSGKDPAAAVRGMTDLLNPARLSGDSHEEQQGVTLLTYLRGVYATDWDNFLERIARLAKAAAAAAAGDAPATNPPVALSPQAAKRIQKHLHRGWQAIRDQDFRAGGVLENWALDLQLWASFRAQVLARTVRGMLCCERALRILGQLEYPRPVGMSQEDYEAWLRELAQAKFTYLVAAQAYGKQRASNNPKERWLAHGIEVLLNRHAAMRVAYLDSGKDATVGGSSVLIKGAAPGSAGGAIEEVYRVRLPVNHYNSGRGVVVGEGKPENQNHAMIFAFGESLQTVDMNQDGCLAEALKTRNLLALLSPVTPGHVSEVGDRGAETVLKEMQMMRKKAPPPTVICGFKEWIFSHKAGALASFAAATEYAFATVIQSDMARGNVRLHYGHPDVFDKLHCMTRGGLSKATRGLHVSEDVLGGLNHTLRGGRITFTEAISCGKGRDMGFNSILTFETKISCGNGEVLLTRDMARLAPRMDLFRLLHFYHSGLGYFVTARLLMLGIYMQALAMAVVALGGYGLVNTNIQLLIQIGLVSSLPYLAQLIFETGIFNALIAFFRQIIAGVVAFSIFRIQTTAHYFAADVTYGGASYIQTGRGFSYLPTSFVQLFACYGRSHTYLGFDLGLLAVVVAASGSAGSQYGALMWGIWLVAASLLAAPLWFNPLSFNRRQVEQDWRQWRQWLQGEVDPEVACSWSTWNRRQLQKIRDDGNTAEGQWKARIMGLVSTCLPHLILAFVSAVRLTSNTSVYLFLTFTLWAAIGITLWLRAKLLDRARFAFWSRLSGLLAIMLIALPVAFIVIVTRLYKHAGDQLFLTLYVQLETFLAFHAAATQLCSGLSAMGQVVDGGFWLIDCLSGSLLLLVVAILSIGGFFEKLQAVLLFNRRFAKSVKDSKTKGLFAQAARLPVTLEEEQTQKISEQLKDAAQAVGQREPLLKTLYASIRHGLKGTMTLTAPGGDNALQYRTQSRLVSTLPQSDTRQAPLLSPQVEPSAKVDPSQPGKSRSKGVSSATSSGRYKEGSQAHQVDAEAGTSSLVGHGMKDLELPRSNWTTKN